MRHEKKVAAVESDISCANDRSRKSRIEKARFYGLCLNESIKNSESDGVRYLLQRADEAVVPLMIDVQNGIPDRPLCVIDLSFHVDASIREDPVNGQQHAGNVPVNVRQPVVLWDTLELTVRQIHAQSGVAVL